MAVRKGQKDWTRVSDDIFLIFQDSMKAMNFNTCNSYLLKIADNEYAIIDPGCSKRKLNKTLKELGLSYSNIKHIYITHGHSDHVNLLDVIRKENPEVKSHAHQLDKPFIEDARAYYEMLFNIPLMEQDEKYSEFLKTIYYYTGVDTTTSIKSSFKMIFDIWNVRNRKVDYIYKDGDILPGGLEVINVPGHMPGMCMFYREKDKILFTADIHLSSIGADITGKASEVSQYKESIQKVLEMVRDGSVEMILSSHGRNPITEDLEGRLIEFYNSLINKEQQLLALLKENGEMSLTEITTKTFKNYIKRFEQFLTDDSIMDTIVIAEASELMANLNILNELEHLNKVKHVDDKWMLI